MRCTDEILEEQCNIQERIILDMYQKLKFYTDLKPSQVDYARKKARDMRKELSTYLHSFTNENDGNE